MGSKVVPERILEEIDNEDVMGKGEAEMIFDQKNVT
jgi:hypothetical protein